MKGTTSIAPIRACSPVCFDISISSNATPVDFIAASKTASGPPTIVTTVRLKSAPMSTSSKLTPSTLVMEFMMASMTSLSLPSLKLGTHSINGSPMASHGD